MEPAPDAFTFVYLLEPLRIHVELYFPTYEAIRRATHEFFILGAIPLISHLKLLKGQGDMYG